MEFSSIKCITIELQCSKKMSIFKMHFLWRITTLPVSGTRMSGFVAYTVTLSRYHAEATLGQFCCAIFITSSYAYLKTINEVRIALRYCGGIDNTAFLHLWEGELECTVLLAFSSAAQTSHVWSLSPWMEMCSLPTTYNNEGLIPKVKCSVFTT
jgi:hypothetical protein